MSNFDSTKRSLPEILREIIKGQIQLPDFQRGWIWDDDHVRSLLISISRSFPVGAVMLLETGGPVNFQMRPIENIPVDGMVSKVDHLILDGQQRLTTLTQVLALPSTVKTRNDKGKAIERYYYFHIPTALEGSEHLEDSLIAIEPDRQLKTNFGRDIILDLSTREKECLEMYFPCSEILNSDAWEEALQEYAPDNFSQYMKFRKDVLSAFRNYQLPIIKLTKETTKEAVCLVFEKVNTGGVPLSVFELMTATYAADGYNLRDDWFGSSIRQVESRKKRLTKEPVLEDVETTDYLQAISMLHTLEKRNKDIAAGKEGKQLSPVSAKRVAILNLPLEAYQQWAGQVESGFLLAAKFLRKECFMSARDLPYRTQLAPLSAVLSILQERWLEPRIYKKIAQWYWCGVLGELYGGAVETRIANDVDELLQWIENDNDNEVPRTISDAAFQPDRLDRLTSRLSAAYKGINILVLREGAQDFFWKANIKELTDEDINLDIHHIFPQAWCELNKIPYKVYNTIVNKTPISYKANRMIGGVAPSKYLEKIQNNKQVLLDDAEMDAILESHLISASILRQNNFDAFYQNRKNRLLEIIETVMGKSTIKVSITEEDDSFSDDLFNEK